MTSTTMTTSNGNGRPVPNAYAAGRLPRMMPWLILVASLIVVAVVFAFMQASDPGSDYNIVGAVLSGVVLYGVVLHVVARLVEGRRPAANRLVTTLVTLAFVIALLPLISLVFTVVVNGLHRFDFEFFTLSLRNVVGAGGGAAHAIIGTLEMTGAAALISVPIGLMASIYLVEYGRGRLSQVITFFVDVMTGLPSIIAGLFAYTLFVIFFGPGVRLGLAGAVALAVLMIPIVVRSSEEILRLVPNELREAALALGVPKWLTILKVVLPTAIAGITTGVMLAIARVVGETAPLLIAAGFTNNFNFSLLSDRMQSLPVYVYSSYVAQGTDAQAYVDRAWAGALTLILLVMLLNLLARIIARVFAPKTGR
jgi:phosphate transport system permease protein